MGKYSKLPQVIASGGFLVMRPKQSEKYKYLINPQSINGWNARTHSDKHYFINNERKNSHSDSAYNDEWIHDIPQLSRYVDDNHDKPLCVDSYPQKTCDVLAPLFTQSNDKRNKNPKPSMPEIFHKNET